MSLNADDRAAENSSAVADSAAAQITANYAESAEYGVAVPAGYMPERKAVIKFIKGIRSVMFPGYFDSSDHQAQTVSDRLAGLHGMLSEQVLLALRSRGAAEEQDAKRICDTFFSKLPDIHRMLLKDAQAGFDGDPAAKSRVDVIFSYPGFFAVFVYRLAHELYVLHTPLIPRIMTEYAHSRTGIDINSGAVIGEYFFIDHGTGVVIGETTEIGDRVKLYQGVTLGALSTRSGQLLSGKKRHPTVQDNVTIYANATILGGDTVIGEGSVIGGNTFITSSVPKNSRVSLKEPEPKIRNGR